MEAVGETAVELCRCLTRLGPELDKTVVLCSNSFSRMTRSRGTHAR